MSNRRYDQFCGLAVALDAIGERWTLLIVREMLLGPTRFNDLLISLHGIGPNMLTARLKHLQDLGLVAQRAVAADGRGREYYLTEFGTQLREPVLQLARWGLGLLKDEDAKGAARPEWAILALEAMLVGRPSPAEVDETYRFDVSGETVYVIARSGEAAVHKELPDGVRPAMQIATDTETFIKIGAGLLTPLAALASGRVQVTGDVDAFERCSALLGLTAPRASLTHS